MAMIDTSTIAISFIGAALTSVIGVTAWSLRRNIGQQDRQIEDHARRLDIVEESLAAGRETFTRIESKLEVLGGIKSKVEETHDAIVTLRAVCANWPGRKGAGCDERQRP